MSFMRGERNRMPKARFLFGFLMMMLLGLQGCLPQAVVVPQTGLNSAPAEPEVRSVEVLRSADPQDIRVIARVSLPNACYRLGDATVSQQGWEFSVTLPVQKVSDQGCASVPISQDQVVRLPADKLAPGNYIVLVNGYLGTFNVATAARQPAADLPTAIATPAAVSTAVEAAAAPTEAPTLAPTTNAGKNPSTSPAPTIGPIETIPPAPLPTSTPAPLALAVGKDPANCTNRAAFYGDLTIPDGTPFEAGSRFTKTWLVMNVGSCTWGSGYQLVFAGGDALGAAQKIPLAQAAPRQVVQISVDMTAPVAPQSYVSDWAILSPDGYSFGMGNPGISPLGAKISVVAREAGLPSGLDCGAFRLKDQEQQVLDQINKTRSEYGLYPLELVEDISQVALKHSLEMACYNRESHRGLDGMLYNVRLQRDNIEFQTSNEIIYSGNGGPAGSIKWWMNSPIHKPIVLSSKYTKVGIGFVYYNGNPYKQRITVDFIHP
jgi:uncharacterized protein YkwD